MKDKLTQEELKNIQSSVDIVDVISSYLSLTSKGKNFFGVCPFHSDHSPSMSVSREKQIYKCFSCGASGNVYGFIMKYENVNFLEAVKIVADKAGISINIGSAKKDNTNKLQILYDIYNISQKFYKNNINTSEGKSAIEFIKSRKFDLDIIRDFDIGLSLKKYDSLTNLLIKKKYSQKDMIRTGLVTKNEKGLKDAYINRIMFPIHDLTGRLVGYSGRVYHGEKTSKYVNTKETEIFKKSEILYNYHKAKEQARLKEQIIIVEGFFATIRLHTIGIDNVIATLGTAFTKQHALTIKRMAKEIILMFDGDSAGEKATDSCIRELSKIGVTPKIVRLEDNLDPDDYVLKYGKNKMLEKIKNPMNVMDFKLNYHKIDKDLTNNQDLSNYINEMIEELKQIDDDIYIELTLKKLADISNISINVLKNKLGNKQNTKIITNTITTKERKLNKYDLAERNLMYYMLNSKDVAFIYTKEKIKFTNKNYELLAKNIVNYLKKYDKIEMSFLLTYYRDDEEILNIINNLISIDIKDDFTQQEIYDYIKVIKERNINKKIKNIKDDMRNTNSNDEKKKLLEAMLELKKKNIEGEQIYDK